MKRKFTPTEIKHGIITAGKGLKLSLDTDIDVWYDGNLYKAHTHKTQEGRIGRLTEFFKDSGFQVGDTIEIFSDMDNNRIVIQRPADQESVEETTESDDINADSWPVADKEDSSAKQNYDNHISNRKAISFTEIKNMLLYRESYKYQGNRHERYVVACEGTTGFKFEVTPYTESVVTAWFWNGFLWMVCDYEGAYRLCKIKDNGRKIADVCTLKQRKGWSSDECRLYILQDNTMLIQMKQSMHYISENSNNVICFDDDGITDSLIYIGRADGSGQEDDWMFLWGHLQDGITWACQRGKRIKAIDIMSEKQRDTIISIVKGEIKNSYPEYSNSELAEEMKVSFLSELHLFEIVFWHGAARVTYASKPSVAVTSWLFVSDEDIIEKGHPSKERCFYLSEDGTHLYNADKETEIDVENFITQDESTVMPEYVKEIIKALYIYYTIDACRVKRVSRKHSMKEIEEDVLAWYDNPLQEGEGDAAFYLTLGKKDEDEYVRYKKKRYFVRKGTDRDGNECIYYAATKEKLHTASARALKIDRRYSYAIHTDVFLRKADIYFKSLAEVLTGYIQMNKFKQSDLHPSEYGVKASELTDKIYGVIAYKKEQYLLLVADLSEYGFAERERVKSDLVTGEIYIVKNGEWELLPKAQLPDPQMIAHVVPTNEMQSFRNSTAWKLETDNRKGRRYNVGNEIRCDYRDDFHGDDYIFGDISIYLQYDGGWVEHPVFRHLKAYVLLENGIIYADDAGVSFAHVSGRNYRISDEKNVVYMEVSKKILVIYLFAKLNGVRTRRISPADDWMEVTEEYYSILTNSRKISIESIYNL